VKDLRLEPEDLRRHILWPQAECKEMGREKRLVQGAVVHTSNPSTKEANAGGS
jgi:hypothetical protein